MTQRDRQESEYSPHERRVEDPAGRPTPFVDGPTGPAPLASELRGDPGEDGDRRAEGGAMGGVLAGTAVAGPVGGVIGGLAGGIAGTAAEAADPDDARDSHDADGRTEGDTPTEQTHTTTAGGLADTRRA